MNKEQVFFLADAEGKIAEKEFDNFEKISIEVLRAALETRELLDTPMYFTKGNNGTPYHPHGDAVSPDSTSHAKFSLHKWGINHVRSKNENKKAYLDHSYGKALDWDAGGDMLSLDDLFDQYLLLSKSKIWNGIGVYPHWNRRGFHTDLRSDSHPSYNAHWFRTLAGSYFPMTWKNWKEFVL